jgi:hypothetical protein
MANGKLRSAMGAIEWLACAHTGQLVFSEAAIQPKTVSAK